MVKIGSFFFFKLIKVDCLFKYFKLLFVIFYFLFGVSSIILVLVFMFKNFFLLFILKCFVGLVDINLDINEGELFFLIIR